MIAGVRYFVNQGGGTVLRSHIECLSGLGWHTILIRIGALSKYNRGTPRITTVHHAAECELAVACSSSRLYKPRRDHVQRARSDSPVSRLGKACPITGRTWRPTTSKRM